MIVDMNYIKDLNLSYHNLKSYSKKYQYDDYYICNKCEIIRDKKNIICIHNSNRPSGDTYCLKCIGGIKNIEKFIISKVILGKVLE